MQRINNGKLIKQCKGNFDIWLDGGHNEHAGKYDIKFYKKMVKSKQNFNFRNDCRKELNWFFKKNNRSI